MTSSETRKKKILLTLGGAVLLTAALVAFFIWLKAYTYVYPIDLKDYVSVVFEGYDEVGTARIVIDREAFREDYSGKLHWEDREDRKKGDPAEAIFDAMEARILENEELKDGQYSNGDELEIRWKNRFFVNRIANAEISAESFTVKAEGLREPGTFDAFEQLEVIYDGLDGEGRVIELWEHSGLERKYGLTYRTLARPEGGPLSNGDTVTVSVGDRETERELIRKYGMKPKEMQKDFTVEGLTTYTLFDPFEGLVLVFKGQNGSGILQDFYNNSPYPAGHKLNYRFEPNQGLRNGDEVHVIASYGYLDREDMARNYGMLPDSMEKVFIVSGLSEESPGEDRPDGGGEDDEEEKVFGKVDRNLYTNAYFKLKAELPSEFTLYGKGNISSDVIGGLNDLYAPSGDTENIGVRIQKLSEEEKGESAREILENYAKEILRIYESYGLKVNYKFEDRSFAGTDYTCMDITAELKVIVVVKRIRHRIFIRKEGDYAVAVSVMAGDDKTLERYCNYFEKFE